MKRIVKLTEKQLKMCEDISEVSMPNEIGSDITDYGGQVGPNITDFGLLPDGKPVTTDDTGNKICRPGWATSIIGKNNYGYAYTKNFGL